MGGTATIPANSAAILITVPPAWQATEKQLPAKTMMAGAGNLPEPTWRGHVTGSHRIMKYQACRCGIVLDSRMQTAWDSLSDCGFNDRGSLWSRWGPSVFK